MGACFKAENFVTAASFAKRMVQGNFGPPEKTKDDVQKARQVLQICEQKGTDKHTINYDPKAAVEDIKICAGSLEAIGAQDTPIYCPYCGSIYKPEFKGKLCDVCNLSEIGANTLGIQLRPIWVESGPQETEKTLQQLSRTPQWNMLRGRPLDFGTTQLNSAKKTTATPRSFWGWFLLMIASWEVGILRILISVTPIAWILRCWVMWAIGPSEVKLLLPHRNIPTWRATFLDSVNLKKISSWHSCLFHSL